MKTVTLYHNPKCSKSREALKILQTHPIQLIIVEYLKNPLKLEQIMQLRAHFNLKEFIRTNEPIFKELKLSLEDETGVLHALLKHPILMQRPIVTYGKLAIIARSPEKISELLD
jgi:arsenate reductase (glutaredoxin)